MGEFVEEASFTVPLGGGPLVPDDDEKNHLVAMLTAAGTKFAEKWEAMKCIMDACYLKNLFIDFTDPIKSDKYSDRQLFQVQYIVPRMCYPRKFKYKLWVFIAEHQSSPSNVWYDVQVVDDL